jgi:hypothetical protein
VTLPVDRVDPRPCRRHCTQPRRRGRKAHGRGTSNVVVALQVMLVTDKQTGPDSYKALLGSTYRLRNNGIGQD